MRITASSSRKANGWAPVLEYPNGGRVVGQQRLGSMAEAIQEAKELIACMAEYPEAFTECHPEPHQCIDLSSRRTGA